MVYRLALHLRMIQTLRHSGLERYLRTGSKAGIQPQQAKRLRLQPGQLDAARGPEDMGRAGWRLHPLKSALHDHWPVWVDENWRLTFKFEGAGAVLVDYHDYH
jgi:proteic killer suppression protein